jgi:putative flippase GtrA
MRRAAVWMRSIPLSAGDHPLAQLIRFGISGVLNTLFGYGLFLLLLKCGMSAGAALIIVPLAAIVFNFQTSKRLVFQSVDRGLLLRFALVYLALLAINYALFIALRWGGLADWAAQGVLVLPVALLSFIVQRTVVFRPVSEPP